jgi:hypothetical protein
MTYIIKQYSYNKAKELGVEIYPSENKNKKIDVYKDDKFVCSIGATGYYDYPTYIQNFGHKIADKRRMLYKLRHNRDRFIKNSCGWWADRILW